MTLIFLNILIWARFMNQLTKIIKHFPDKPWNWGQLSVNQNIKINFVKENLNLLWDWYSVSCNEMISLEDIENNPDLPWDWQGVSLNPNLNLKFVSKHLNKDWNWTHVTACYNITLDEMLIEGGSCRKIKIPWTHYEMSSTKVIKPKYIARHNGMEFVYEFEEMWSIWDWYGLSLNPRLDHRLIVPHKDEWNWELLSQNEGIGMEFIKNHPDLSWNYESMSKNSHITLDFVRDNLDKNWNWKELSSKFGLEVIENNPDLPWNLSKVTITPDFIVKTLNKCRESANKLGLQSIYSILISQLLSNNSGLLTNCIYDKKDIETMLKYPEIKWDWRNLCRDSSITFDYVKENPKLPWNWSGLSGNPNLRLQDILDFPDKPWDWEEMSDNEFEYHKPCLNDTKMSKEMKDEIKIGYDQIMYKPGNCGYHKTEDHFKTMVNAQ